MLKYVQVDSDGYAYLGWEDHRQLHKLGYMAEWDDGKLLLSRIRMKGFKGEVVCETTDHVLFDNYLKLLLED